MNPKKTATILAERGPWDLDFSTTFKICRSCFAVTSRLLRAHNAVTTQSLRGHYAVTTVTTLFAPNGQFDQDVAVGL